MKKHLTTINQGACAMCDVCLMCDVIIHIVNTDERIEYGGKVITNCGSEFLYTKPSPWPKRGLCPPCLKGFEKRFKERFEERKTDLVYTVTEVRYLTTEHAPET